VCDPAMVNNVFEIAVTYPFSQVTRVSIALKAAAAKPETFFCQAAGWVMDWPMWKGRI